MSDQSNNNPAPADAGAPPAADATASTTTAAPSGSEEPKFSEAELKEAFKKRDLAKAKAKELEAKLAEYEAREKQRSQASMTLEQQLEAAQAELQALKAEETKRAYKTREERFLAKVVEHVGQSSGVVRGLLLAAKEDHGFDIAPEDFGMSDVKRAASLLKEIDPSLFAPKSGGAPTPSPGLSSRSLAPEEMPSSDDDNYWLSLAKSGGLKNRKR